MNHSLDVMLNCELLNLYVPRIAKIQQFVFLFNKKRGIVSETSLKSSCSLAVNHPASPHLITVSAECQQLQCSLSYCM